MRNAIKRLAACLVIVSGMSAVAQAAGDDAKKPVKWEPIGLSGGGSMYRPSFSPVDPNLAMFNSDMSCAFMSYDAGKNWVMINASQLKSSTACYPGYHPTDASTIFAPQAGHGLKVTHDKGVTWTQVEGLPTKPLAEGQSEPDLRNLCGKIELDHARPDRMMVGDETTVFITQDGGKTWTECKGPTGRSLCFHFDQTGQSHLNYLLWA